MVAPTFDAFSGRGPVDHPQRLDAVRAGVVQHLDLDAVSTHQVVMTLNLNVLRLATLKITRLYLRQLIMKLTSNIPRMS